MSCIYIVWKSLSNYLCIFTVLMLNDLKHAFALVFIKHLLLQLQNFSVNVI